MTAKVPVIRSGAISGAGREVWHRASLGRMPAVLHPTNESAWSARFESARLGPEDEHHRAPPHRRRERAEKPPSSVVSPCCSAECQMNSAERVTANGSARDNDHPIELTLPNAGITRHGQRYLGASLQGRGQRRSKPNHLPGARLRKLTRTCTSACTSRQGWINLVERAEDLNLRHRVPASVQQKPWQKRARADVQALCATLEAQTNAFEIQRRALWQRAAMRASKHFQSRLSV